MNVGTTSGMIVWSGVYVEVRQECFVPMEYVFVLTNWKVHFGWYY